METLKAVIADIYNPVIQDVDTIADDNRRYIEISKMIDSLHEEKINAILTINYVLSNC